MFFLATAVLQVVQGAQAPRFPDFPRQDALSYSLDLKLDLEKPRLSGSVEYRIKALARLSKVRFHARRSDSWRVDFEDAAGHPLRSNWVKNEAHVTLLEPAAKDSVVVLRARISGVPVDGFYFKKSRYGKMMAFTDHYSIRARGWLPCEDHPADRASWRLRLVYPKGLHATAYGRRLDNSEGSVPDGFEVLESVSDTEVPPYMFALVVGPFVLIPEAGDPRLRPHLVYEQDAERARSSLRHHAKWMKIMEQTFGVYSYKKYTTAQCPTRWGGFEAPGNVQLSERIFDGADGGVGTLAHEFVHMWFGDGVGYARWHEVWLSEGFASYFGPWLNAAVGGPDLRSSMIRLRDRWRRSRDGRIKTVRDDSFPHPDMALNANTYPKGAWILHMLRRELGDETFFKALRAYYVECRNKSVLTENFVACVKIVNRKDLSWFFTQWLDRVGCPELRVRHSADAEPHGLVIEQTQKGEPYTFWLKLEWTGNDGVVRNREVRVRERTTVVKIPGSIDDLQLDPDVQLLFRQK